MSEAQEQIAVIQYCDLKHLPIFAIPNGGSRNKIEAANLKRQGVKAGVPDLMLPIARGEYHGLFIEMKFGRNKTSEKQDRWIDLLRKNGYRVEVCYGFDQAREVLDEYMRT